MNWRKKWKWEKQTMSIFNLMVAIFVITYFLLLVGFKSVFGKLNSPTFHSGKGTTPACRTGRASLSMMLH